MRPLRVLYALWHYPQLSESYVRTEIAAMTALGVHVEVWSEEEVSSPFPSEVPVHRGRLADVVARVKPDIAHTHWLNMAERFSAELQAAGVPLTVRGHGFEFSAEVVARVDRNAAIHAAYLFPHFAATCTALSAKIKPLPVTFNPALYAPSRHKDRRLVMRTACALPSKGLRTFMETARLCPRHRFVLVVCRAFRKETYIDTVIAQNAELGEPVEVLCDLQHEEVATLMNLSAIYMHTNGDDATFGMPISIGEAMATGSYLIARRSPAAADYVGDAGALYETAEEAAALIWATHYWNDDNWRAAQQRSVHRAQANFVSTDVLPSIVADWRAINQASRVAVAS